MDSVAGFCGIEPAPTDWRGAADAHFWRLHAGNAVATLGAEVARWDGFWRDWRGGGRDFFAGWLRAGLDRICADLAAVFWKEKICRKVISGR